MQITQWHKGTDKPVRDGVYQRRFWYGIEYALFKGEWMLSDAKYEIASIETWPSMAQNDPPWRGVTKP